MTTKHFRDYHPGDAPASPHALTALRRPVRALAAGFSLVEVTLSMGILAFALVSLVGLMPAGLSTFRESMNRSVSAEIAQRIINEARQTDFTTLVTGGDQERYFTAEGDETTGMDISRVYIARSEVTQEVEVPAGENVFVNTSMARIRIQIANSPAGNVTDENSQRWHSRQFQALIPKM